MEAPDNVNVMLCYVTLVVILSGLEETRRTRVDLLGGDWYARQFSESRLNHRIGPKSITGVRLGNGLYPCPLTIREAHDFRLESLCGGIAATDLNPENPPFLAPSETLCVFWRSFAKRIG